MSGDDVDFGRFRLNLKTRKLSRDGTSIALAGRALDILCALAAARGKLVSKDELLARVWPGREVSENNIQVHVSALRKLLHTGKDRSGHVITVPGRGYRLLGVESRLSEQIGATAIEDRPSIAVLPFHNISDDPVQGHFADGIVEEIITGLSRIRWLSVIARNSSFLYRGHGIDVRQVGRDLGARYVLEGSVRKSGKRVRITGQLIDGVSGAHVWADHFDLRELEPTLRISNLGTQIPYRRNEDLARFATGLRMAGLPE